VILDPTKRFFNDPSQFQKPPSVYVNVRGGDDQSIHGPEPLRGWFGGPAVPSIGLKPYRWRLNGYAVLRLDTQHKDLLKTTSPMDL
jgi:hypothetical protein